MSPGGVRLICVDAGNQRTELKVSMLRANMPLFLSLSGRPGFLSQPLCFSFLFFSFFLFFVRRSLVLAFICRCLRLRFMPFCL